MARSQHGVLERFAEGMEKQWMREVVCSCWSERCNRKYQIVCVPAMKKWMTTVEDGERSTNLDLVLDALQSHRKPFGIRSETILEGEHRCVRVMGILLYLGHGHLIDLFQSAHVFDTQIMYTVASSPEQLVRIREHLKMHYIPELEAGRIVDDFEKQKWAFCTPEMQLGKEHNLGGDEIRLPFCRRQRISEKGGTADVYQVSIQKDFVSDVDLIQSLKKSLYNDKDYGDCYQIAIKSYAKNLHFLYETEKNNFDGFKDRSIPIVRCLGCYSCQSGTENCLGGEEDANKLKQDTKVPEKTYNLMLEFGDMDLDEYWAADDTAAPVRTEEIICYYRSLSQVAEALKYIHSLKIDRSGGTLEFNGWHADIKPDNILRVHGQFKLADFGFAKFRGRVNGDNTVPREYLDGGTDAYGAPEAARARATKSQVDQSIDTWSLGCVLSVAATWVVLGYQGIFQYSRLRSDAVKKRKGDRKLKIIDRFHDGEDVLPEIEAWHDYLKQHIRKHDTVTEKILDLIQNDMLKGSPSYRIGSAELCQKLERILEQSDMEAGKIRKTHQSVLQALLQVDKEASDSSSTHQFSSAINFSGMRLNEARNSDLQRQLGTAPGAKRIRKAERMTRFTAAKTSFRQEILELALKTPQLKLNTQTVPRDAHRPFLTGDMRHSPTELESEKKADERVLTPSNRSTYKTEASGSDDLSHRSNRHGDNIGTQPQRSYRNTTKESCREKTPSIRSPDENIVHHHPQSIPQSEIIRKPSSRTTLDNADPERTPVTSSEQRARSSGEGVPIPVLRSPSRERLGFSPASETSRPESSLIWNEKEAAETPVSQLERTHFRQLHTDASQTTFEHVFDLPYNICRVREEIDKPRSAIKRWFSKEKVDETLQQFISARDIVFVIDNGASMRKWWPVLIFVVETLERKLRGLDEDGIDVRFAIFDNYEKVIGLKGKDAAEKLRKRLGDKVPNNESKTDMAKVLQGLFDECRVKEFQKKTTFLVFTDGLWKGTISPTETENEIVRFAKDLDKKGLANHYVTIEFIRFGVEGMARLRHLDDKIAEKHEIRDMVDETSWKHYVEKMILGSLSQTYDNDDNHDEILEGPDMAGSKQSQLGEEKLIELFDEFNKREASLTPTKPGHSRSSSSRSLGSPNRGQPETSNRIFSLFGS